MPTPSHYSEIARQSRIASATAPADGWTEATVGGSVSEIGNGFQVSLDGATGLIEARTAIYAPLVPGARVWTIPTPSGPLIVGLQ